MPLPACPNCAYLSPTGLRFCGQCGGRLDTPGPKPPGDRRPLTILFCDLVGSTRLSGLLHPEDLRQVLLAFREACAGAIARRGGTVGQYLGDGILAYFGHPRAQEDDALRAVRAALEARSAMAPATTRLAARGIPLPTPLQARFGVHSGLVVVADLGDGGLLEASAIVGETTNIAARLQAAAAPGQVLLSGATAALTERHLALRDRGLLHLAGVEGAVQAFEAQGERPRGLVHSPATPFLGRLAEMDRLVALWHAAIARDGAVAVIEAEPGLGKSRLVHEFQARFAGARVTLACTADDRATAYQPLLSWLLDQVALESEAGGEARRAGLQRVVAAAGIDPAAHAPPLAILLDCATDADEATSGDTPRQRRRRLTEALLALLTAPAQAGPLLLLVEDLHWIDESTFAIVRALAERCFAGATPGVLLLLTVRPGEGTQRDLPGTVIRLAGLSDADALSLARAAAPPGTEAAVLDEIVRRADGVPLFAEEVARAARPQPGRDPADTIPMTLHSALAAQLDRLDAAKRVAQAAAVIGRFFQTELLEAAVDDADRPTLPATLQQLVDARYIEPQDSGGMRGYSFRHALIRDAAYDSLLREPRRTSHLRIADVLRDRFPETVGQRPELLGRHYGAAGRIGDAATYYELAARRAAARSTHVEAAEHCRLALMLLQDSTTVPDRTAREFRLQVALAAQVTAMRGNADPEVQAAFQKAMEAAERLGERRGLRRALRGLHTYHLVRGDVGAGHAISRRVMALGGDVDDPGERMQLHRPHGLTLLYLGHFEPARDELRRALALYDPDSHAEQRFEYGSDPAVLARSHLGWVEWFLGGPARAESQAAIAAARDLQHPHSLAFSLAFAACLHQFAADPAEALHAASELQRLSEQHDYAYWSAWAQIVRGWADATLGDPLEGETTLREGLRRYEATGAGLLSPYANHLLAGIVAGRDLAEALALRAHAAAQAEAGTMGIWRALFAAS